MADIFERGATWRRWDLHIHSPESIDQRYGGPSEWPQFIESLGNLPEDVNVIGINDYYFIDGYEYVIKEKLNGGLHNLEKVFPVIELRIDTFGSASGTRLSKINLHVLFNVDEESIEDELKLIRERFIERISLCGDEEYKNIPLSKENMTKEARDSKLATGFRDFIPSTKQVFDLLNKKPWKGKTLVFLGYDEWHSLDKGQQAKLTKERLYKSADAFLSASSEDAVSKKQAILNQFGRKVFLHSLDIHGFEQFEDYKCLTWIKADPTFNGLRHALLNASERIYLGQMPPRLERERHNPYCFASKLAFESTTVDDGWFDRTGELPLNAGLVAIIGDKGNGKSALADTIALGGNSYAQHYSFLNRFQFLSSPTHKRYSATLTFCDGTRNRVQLGDPNPILSKPERVTYLSQSFVNYLCEEVDGAQRLREEIDRVIFAHIPEAKRLRQKSLSDLVKHRAGSFERELQGLREKLAPINEEIVQLEDLIDDQYREHVISVLAEVNDAIRAHERLKPVKPPEEAGGDIKLKLVEKYVGKQTTLEALAGERQASIATKEYVVDQLSKARERGMEIQKSGQELVRELQGNEVFSETGLDAETLVKVTVNTEALDEFVAAKASEIERSNVYVGRVQRLIEVIEALIERLRAGQSEVERRQHDYIKEMRTWTKKQEELLGSEANKSNKKWCEAELKRIEEEYPKKLEGHRVERDKLAKAIVDALYEKEDAIKDIYSYVQRKAVAFASELEIPVDEFLEFAAKVSVSDDFTKQFFAFINQNRSGTFYRHDEGGRQLTALLPSESEISKGVLMGLPNAIVNALNHNLQNDPTGEDLTQRCRVKDQLVGDKDKRKRELYDYLFSFQYVQARFSITYTGKPMEKLSPGEKAILLLAFYLLIDEKETPIIIDQPEENVGNMTISRRLVEFIKVARRRRQIIIVTHNANLAIVCDADQIIYSQMDKVSDNSVKYLSGSIEYDPIKGKSINILEGTKKAFDSRKRVWESLPES